MSAALRWNVWLTAIAAVFAFGLGMVTPRTFHASDPELRIRGDALEYIQLGRGAAPSAVAVPFRYRVLVPWMASALPLPVERAIRAVSLLCLLGVLISLMVIGARLGLGTVATALGIASVSGTSSMLYAFHNPYLTDQFGVLMVTAALAALLGRRPLMFAALVTLGSIGRESVAFIAPAYLITSVVTRNGDDLQRRGLLLLGMVLPVLASVILRVLPTFGEHGLARYIGYYSPTLGELGPIRRPLDFIIGVAMSWEWVWIASLAGLALMGSALAPGRLGKDGPPWTRVGLRVTFVLLMAGGLATIVANGMLDPNRHLLGAAPVVAIGVMVFVHAVRCATTPAAFTAGVASIAV